MVRLLFQAHTSAGVGKLTGNVLSVTGTEFQSTGRRLLYDNYITFLIGLCLRRTWWVEWYSTGRMESQEGAG